MEVKRENKAEAAGTAEDEVVREIDVFLSPELAQQIYLVQYPLQHDDVTTPASARIKPRHGMLQEDHAIPEVSIEQDGMYVMDKRTYDSQTIQISTHMCIGKFQPLQSVTNDENSIKTDALHLVPLTHISQMRPSFRHVDEEHEDDTIEDETRPEDDEQSPEKKPVIFQRKESERAAMARKSSYAFKRASEDAEEWLDLEVYSEDVMDDSNARENILQKVICPVKNQSILANHAENDYVQSLNYVSVATDYISTQFQGSDMKSIAFRMTSLLKSGGPIPFLILRSQFDAEIPNDVLFQALNTCAVLCRGNWCLHSKFLAVNEPLKRVRTFVLFLLQEHGMVDRRRLSHVYSKHDSSYTSADKLLAVLKVVGKRGQDNGGKQSGWVLKVDDDAAFLEKHPDLRKLHDDYWTRQRQRFRDELRAYAEQQQA